MPFEATFKCIGTSRTYNREYYIIAKLVARVALNKIAFLVFDWNING